MLTEKINPQYKIIDAFFLTESLHWNYVNSADRLPVIVEHDDWCIATRPMNAIAAFRGCEGRNRGV